MLPEYKENKSEGKERRRRAVLVASFIPYVLRSPTASTLTYYDLTYKGGASRSFILASALRYRTHGLLSLAGT